MNTVKLLGDLYSNSDLRQQLAGAAPQVIDLTEKVMAGGAKTVEESVQNAMTGVYTGAVTRALKDATATADSTDMGSIKTEATAQEWINLHVKDAKQQSDTLAALGKEIDAGSKALLEQRAKDAALVRSMLAQSSFDVLAVSWKKGAPIWPEIPGVLATAALLSLGAPFWFNLLKSLTNLRPILANKQDPDAK